jgi:general L-amino acid transport system substrate-binding protein
MNRKWLLGLILVLLGLSGALAQQSRLDVVKGRGRLVCGVNAVLPGFGFLDQKTGKYAGFDVEFCRAVAAALFGDPDKVDYVPLDARVRFQAVQNGEVDVAFRNTTVTANRDGALGVDFLPVTFYDGQGVMVKKAGPTASGSSWTPPSAPPRAPPTRRTSPTTSAPRSGVMPNSSPSRTALK